MPGRSFRIARIAGIPVGVSPWWLVIVGLITWTLGADYFPSVVTNISPGLSYSPTSSATRLSPAATGSK
jgi:hypothetical protein